MKKDLKIHFPKFAKSMDKIEVEELLDGLTNKDIIDLEENLNVNLPDSYKKFLTCTRGFVAFGGSIQIGEEHPFFHKFEPFEKLTSEKQMAVKQKGGTWPPPSNGMLCFAEFFMEGDGDQVLFDIKQKDANGEYPVYYYNHDEPSVRKIADSFGQWLNEFPNYEEFAD